MLLFIIKQTELASANDTCFNTSHVTLYLERHRIRRKSRGFQYISCYSLSRIPSGDTLNLSRFNTSHVTLYQERNWINVIGILFQYISCYSLSGFGFCKIRISIVSIHLMLLFIFYCYEMASPVFGFQYISCYSLSCHYITEDPNIEFQYISCYSLSWML